MAQAAHEAQISVLSCPSRACASLSKGKPFCPCSRTAWSTLTLCLCWLPSPFPPVAAPLPLLCSASLTPIQTPQPEILPIPLSPTPQPAQTLTPEPLTLSHTPRISCFQPHNLSPSPSALTLPQTPLIPFSSTPQPKILPFPFPVPHNHSPGLFPFTLPHTPLTLVPLSPTAGGLCSLFNLAAPPGPSQAS